MNIISKTFQQVLSRNPRKLAIIHSQTSRDYAGLFSTVLRWVSFLHSQEIKANDLIALHVADEVLHFEASLALLLLGTRQITYATHDSPELHDRLETALEPDLVISDSAHTSQWRSRKKLFISRELNEEQDIFSNFEILDERSTGSILLKTSGTTGGLNIVEISTKNLKLQALRHPEYQTDGLLRFASIEHNNSKRHRIYVFLNGGLNIFRSGRDDEWLEHVKRKELKILDISRLHILELLHRYSDGQLSTLKIRTGGSAIPHKLRQSVINNLTKEFYVRYATTEFGGIAMANKDMHTLPGCAGKALQHVKIEIVNENHEVLPRGQTGLIRVQGAGAANKYIYTDAESNKDGKFFGDFFYPGDMGYMADDGCLVIEGRHDDMIIMNGLNIFPNEVETALEEIQPVQEAICLGIDSHQHGQIPVAAVTIKHGYTPTEAALIRDSRKKLALKAPRKIYIIDQIPLNAAGKHDRLALRKSLQTRHNQ